MRILSIAIVLAAAGVASADCGGVCRKTVALPPPAVIYQAAPVVASPPVAVVEYQPVVTGYMQLQSTPVAVRPTFCQRVAARLIHRRAGIAAARADRVGYVNQWVSVPASHVHAD